MKHSKYRHVCFTEILELVYNLHSDFVSSRGVTHSDSNLIVMGINRGGLVPGICLSHSLGVRHVPLNISTRDHSHSNLDNLKYFIKQGKRILIVDDINDTGKTFCLIDDAIDKMDIKKPVSVDCATLYQRSTSEFYCDFTGCILESPEWIVFPWEDV